MDLHYIVQREGQNQKQKTTTLPIYGSVIQRKQQFGKQTGEKSFTTKHCLPNASTNVLVNEIILSMLLAEPHSSLLMFPFKALVTA